MRQKCFTWIWATSLLLMISLAVQAQDFNYTTNIDNTITITSYTGFGENVEIPKKINDLLVTAIGEQAFSYSGLTSVIIPNSVTNIGSEAFEFCDSLNDVTIPNSVTTVEDWAFRFCHSLTSITIPNSVTTIGYGVFYFCPKLASVIIQYGVTNLDSMAFYGCTGLTEVYFWGNAPTLGWNVFGGGNNTVVYYLPETTGWDSTFGDRSTAQWTLLSHYLLTVSGGAGSGWYTNREPVSVMASYDPDRQIFSKWIGDTQYLASVTSPIVAMTMPDQAVALTATYIDRYALTVTDGSGSGFYTNQQQVAIIANIPTIGAIFCQWAGATEYIEDITSASTFLAMPSADISVTPTYFTYEIKGASVAITGWRGISSTANIPSMIDDLPVTSIQSNAFDSCTNLTGVVIGNNVTNRGGLKNLDHRLS